MYILPVKLKTVVFYFFRQTAEVLNGAGSNSWYFDAIFRLQNNNTLDS